MEQVIIEKKETNEPFSAMEWWMFRQKVLVGQLEWEVTK